MTNIDNNKIIQTIAGRCLSGRIRLLNRIINSIYDKAIRPHGIKASQLNILIASAYYGKKTSKELCSHLQMDTSTFSRALSRLRDSGFMTSEPSGDGKILAIEITDSGIKKIEEIYPAWLDAQRQAAELLGESAEREIRKTGTRFFLER